jgi:hypothetical protein
MSFIKLEKDLLRHFFRKCLVMEEIAGDAVDQPLVL